MFMKEGIVVILIGIGTGVFGAAAIGKLLEAQLYGVRPLDLWTMITMSCIIRSWRSARSEMQSFAPGGHRPEEMHPE